MTPVETTNKERAFIAAELFGSLIIGLLSIDGPSYLGLTLALALSLDAITKQRYSTAAMESLILLINRSSKE
ncbi:MAG: hypothetical protein V1487_01125 [bacterium]